MNSEAGPRTRSRVAGAIIALALLVGGAVGARALLASAPEAPEQPAAPPRPVPVEVVRLEPRTLRWAVEATGTLEPRREARLATSFGGEVVWVREGLVPGSRVEAGEVLVRLDPGPLDLEIAAQRTAVRLTGLAEDAARASERRGEESLGLAEERLALAEAEEQRWQRLDATGVAEATRLDAARNAALAARSALTEARRALEAAQALVRTRAAEVQLADERLAILVDRRGRLELEAPFAGRFVGLAAATGAAPAPSVGDVLGPFAPIGSIAAVDGFRARVAVHADDLASLRVGAACRVRPTARPDRVLEGVIVALGARVDPRTRTVDVELDVPVPDAEGGAPLPAGSFALFALDAVPLESVLAVEEAWIAHRGGQEVLFVVEGEGDGTEVTAVPVELGAWVDGARVLRAGPGAGTRIAVRPLALLGTGSRVTVRGADPAPVPPEARTR